MTMENENTVIGNAFSLVSPLNPEGAQGNAEEGFVEMPRNAYSGIPEINPVGAGDFNPLENVAFSRARAVTPGEGFAPFGMAQANQENVKKSAVMLEIESMRRREEEYFLERERLLKIREAEIEAGHARNSENERRLQDLENELKRKSEALDARSAEIESEKNDLDAEGKALDSIAAKLAEMKKGYWIENTDEIVNFSLQLAERLVMEKIVKNPSPLIRHIQNIIDELKIEEPVIIYMAPDDLDRLRHSKLKEVKSLMLNPRIKWLGDTRIKAGEVHMDTSNYRLDASIMTAFRNLKEDMFTDSGEDEGEII